MKLIANQGSITVQAQNDLMELLARKAITITSTEDEINHRQEEDHAECGRQLYHAG